SGSVALNGLQRRYSQLTLAQVVQGSPFIPHVDVALASVTVSVDFLVKNKARGTLKLDCKELSEAFKESFLHQAFNLGQELAWDFNGNKLAVQIQTLDISALNESSIGANQRIGQLLSPTRIDWTKTGGSPIQLSG
ncbi:unnamed protein product, partial [Heterosigma akashiwo]